MKKKIELINSKNGWLARFVDDAKVIDLFGTDTIPTAFTEVASPLQVKRSIEKLNPGYEVFFAC